jgi:hypothetical protein
MIPYVHAAPAAMNGNDKTVCAVISEDDKKRMRMRLREEWTAIHNIFD